MATRDELIEGYGHEAKRLGQAILVRICAGPPCCFLNGETAVTSMDECHGCERLTVAPTGGVTRRCNA